VLGGVVEQGTIDDIGSLVKKQCVIHDQSLPDPSGLSVNKCVIAASITACMFGFCLKRIIQCIVSLCQCHPTKRVLVGKFDWKSAYHRTHLSGQTSLEGITQVNCFLVAFLHMQFGGKPCPAQWSSISEMACDLTKALHMVQLAVIRDNSRYSLTLFSKFYASFLHGDCLISVYDLYLALDGVYHLIRSAFSIKSTLQQSNARHSHKARTEVSPSSLNLSRKLGYTRNAKCHTLYDWVIHNTPLTGLIKYELATYSGRIFQAGSNEY
jgi:hypothetical protein